MHLWPASYGTYKAALVVVNMLEKTNMILLRQAVIEKKLAAAANITLSNSMAIAAARGKMFALVQRNIISTFKGVGKILSNPYVLFAAAVGTATYAMYNFYTRETEAEKMQKQYNETKEASARLEEQHKTKIDELINSIENETTAEIERVGAMEILKKMYPGIIEKYIDEEGHLKNLIALKKELSEEDVKSKTQENKTELQSYDERIKSQQEYIDRMRTSDQSAFDDEIAKLEELKREREITRGKVASDFINQMILDSKSLSDDKLKNTIDTYKKLLSENIEGESFSGSKDFKVDEIKKFVSALEDLQKARLNAVQNKEYWEKKKKEAETARDALDISKKNSEDWNKYTEQIQKAESQIAKYSSPTKQGNEYFKQQEAIRSQNNKIAEIESKQAISRQRQAEDLQNKITQSEIDAMEEGEEKILRQRHFNNEKEIQDIQRQKDDYKNAVIQAQKELFEAQEELNAIQNKKYQKKTFNPSSVVVDTSGFDILSNNMSRKKLNERIQEQESAWNDYLIKYGNYHQKRKAITEKYDQEINKSISAGAAATLTKDKEKSS